MKRLTVDIEHVKLPIKQLASKLSLQKKRKIKIFKREKIFKRDKIKLSPKKPKDLRKFIQKEHSYVKISDASSPIIHNSIFPIPLTRQPPDQLSLVPTHAKVNTKPQSYSPPKKSSIGPFKDGGIVAGSLIENNRNLFNAAVKEIIIKIQSAVDIDGECIIRKVVKHLGESWVMSIFIPIKLKSDQNGYLNFMQLTSDMDKIFTLLKKNLELLKKYRTLNSLSRLERIFYSEVVGNLAIDKALVRVLYPLYATSFVHTPTKPILTKPIISPKLKKKVNKNKGVIDQIQNASAFRSPIVILSDDDKNEARLPPGPDLLSTTIISNNFHPEFPQFQPTSASTPNTQLIAKPSTTTTTPPPDPIQIRSEESEEGYTITTALKKSKSNKARGEFENYMRFLVEKYLDKNTAITAQKKENLEMVIKQASVMYPEQYHDVRKRIRSILRNTRRNKSRLMIRNLKDFGNSTSFNITSSPSTTPHLMAQKETSRQIVMPQPPHTHMVSPFASFTQQSTVPPDSVPIITISNPSLFGTDISKRTQGVRFKIPQHLEVLQPPPLVSVEGDLAKQFVLYNYIASQKDSDGYHLCSHFLEHTSNKDENVRLRQPIDMRTIALKIKICWYSSLKDLVKDLELMLDNNIKLHQMRSFVGRDALKLRQLMSNMVKELMKEDVVDLTSGSTKAKEDNISQNTPKMNTKQQLNNFFQALENYRDTNSRVLLFTFLFPPSGLKTPVSEKNFATLTDVKLNLKNNTYKSLHDLAHSVLYIIHTFLSVYLPKSQAFRDSEEMAKYVQMLYKEQTGESMQVTRTVPEQYALPGRKGQFTLALPTADFLEISYNRLFQCFTIVPAGESDIQVLCAQGMRHTSVPVIHLVPFKEVESLINQKLKCTNSESIKETVAHSNPEHIPDVPSISPIQHTPIQHMPAQHMSTQHMPAQHMSTQSTPTQHMPTHSTPIQHMPTQHMPTQHMPTHSTPIQHMPTQHMPAQHMPAQHMPTQSTPIQHMPTQSTPIQHMPTQSTPIQSTPTITKMFNSIKFKAPLGSKLNSYHFPSLMFKQYVIKRELCHFLGWCEETFEVLFHSLRQIRAGQTEKDHLFKVYKVHEHHKNPFFLILYEDIKELESMGEKSKGNKLIADIFRQEFPQGVLKGSSNKWNKFLQFVDDRNKTYFIIRELMNKMNVTLQDMMLIMRYKVFQLDEFQGLIWIKEWEDIVNKIQKNPRNLESMVCLYNEQLEIGLNEMESMSKTGQVRGKMLVNRFFLKMPTSTNLSSDTNKTDPITISSEDEERREISIQRQPVPEAEEQYVSLQDLATYLGWSEVQVESVFGKDQQLQLMHGSKFLVLSHVNQILESINYASKKHLNVSAFSTVMSKDEMPRLWTLPNMREKHIILEDLGEYASIPMDVLEITYQVYIYDVKSDKDKIILAQQGLNMMDYTNKPIRMIDQSKVKWILDMKAKKETINFKSRTKEKKKVIKPSPKTDVQLKELSIQLIKAQVDPVKMYKYNVFQLLTVECKILTLENANRKKIKLQIIDAERLRKPHIAMKTYTVDEKEVVISHHLSEYTHIPQSNLFLFLLSYGVTYYSNTAPTAKLRIDFEQYNLRLKSQGMPSYKNVTIYPCDELEQLLSLRKIGFTNVKLIETYNLIQTTSEKQLTIALASNSNQKVPNKKGNKQSKPACKDTYSIDFKIHTIKDTESEKTVILKIFDDHYLFKPREQIMVYQIRDDKLGEVRIILLHDLARFTNIPLTRLQTILNNYSIPSLSYTCGDIESQDTFIQYFTQLHDFGVPHYMKHTTLYQLEHLSSLLHLREVGFFNEKLLDVYKMIKLSSSKQKRILLTIKPTAPVDIVGTKRQADIPAGSPQTKILKPSSLNKSSEIEKILKKGLVTVPAKLINLKPLPTHYRLASSPGEWVLVSELTYFLNLTYSTILSKFKSRLELITSVDDYIKLKEQDAKLAVNKMLLLPLYVVSGIIDMKTRGDDLQSIKQEMEDIENKSYNFLSMRPEYGKGASKNRKTEENSIISGTTASYQDLYRDEDIESELDTANLPSDETLQCTDYIIHTLWRNNTNIKLKIPWTYSHHIQRKITTFPKTLTVKNINFNFYSLEEMAEFVQMGIQELKIGLGRDGIVCPDGLPNSANVTFLLRATEDLQLFIALRRMGIPKHRVWLVYFACKKITSNEKNDLTLNSEQQTMFSEERLEIGLHDIKLILAESILQKKVLLRHICAVYNIAGSTELYYIAEEVAVEMQVSLVKLLNTKKLMKYKKIKRKFTDNRSDKLSFTMVRVDDLQHLSLLYNLGISGSVALDIFQYLKQLPDSSPQYTHDFTSLCKKGYSRESPRKWMLLNNWEAVNLHQVASTLRVEPELLERWYYKECHKIHLNSIEHVFLLSQGFQFPTESTHCTVTSAKLLKDVCYLSKLKTVQIRQQLTHKPAEWPNELYANPVEGGEAGRELVVRTVTIESISIRIISKENLKFKNVVNVYLMQNPTPHYVVLGSDLKRAFTAINYMTVLRLCESVKLDYREPTSLDCKCLSLQMDSLTPEKLASMVLVQLNKHLRLILLLLALGVNIFELWRVVKDSNWVGFHENIAVLLTRPEEFDEWLYDYFTERSDNDPHFYDLSQEYPYFLAEISPPPSQPVVITTLRKALKNTDFLPFWLWKLNSSSYSWVTVASIKSLLPRKEIPRSLLLEQKVVLEDSNEGRVLLSQGFCFSQEREGFIKYQDVWNNLDLVRCMRRMLQMINQRIEDFSEEDISLHTFVTPLGRVKVFTHLKHHRKILLKKYAIATGKMSAKPMVSVDELLSLIPDESSRSDILSYITDTMNIRTLSRSNQPAIKLIKWSQGGLFARLVQIGCSIDIDFLLELHNLLSKQTEYVFKQPSPQTSTSLWFFLEGEQDYDHFQSCESLVHAPDSDIPQLGDLTLASETKESELSTTQEAVSTSEDTELQLHSDLAEYSYLDSNPHNILTESGDSRTTDI